MQVRTRGLLVGVEVESGVLEGGWRGVWVVQEALLHHPAGRHAFPRVATFLVAGCVCACGWCGWWVAGVRRLLPPATVCGSSRLVGATHLTTASPPIAAAAPSSCCVDYLAARCCCCCCRYLTRCCGRFPLLWQRPAASFHPPPDGATCCRLFGTTPLALAAVVTSCRAQVAASRCHRLRAGCLNLLAHYAARL